MKYQEITPEYVSGFVDEDGTLLNVELLLAPAILQAHHGRDKACCVVTAGDHPEEWESITAKLGYAPNCDTYLVEAYPLDWIPLTRPQCGAVLWKHRDHPVIFFDAPVNWEGGAPYCMFFLEW